MGLFWWFTKNRIKKCRDKIDFVLDLIKNEKYVPKNS